MSSDPSCETGTLPKRGFAEAFCFSGRLICCNGAANEEMSGVIFGSCN